MMRVLSYATNYYQYGMNFVLQFGEGNATAFIYLVVESVNIYCKIIESCDYVEIPLVK